MGSTISSSPAAKKEPSVIKHPWRTHDDGVTFDYRADTLTNVDRLFLAHIAHAHADRCTVHNVFFYMRFDITEQRFTVLDGMTCEMWMAPAGVDGKTGARYPAYVTDFKDSVVGMSAVLNSVELARRKSDKRFSLVRVVKQYYDGAEYKGGHFSLVLFDHIQTNPRWILVDPKNSSSYYSASVTQGAIKQDHLAMDALTKAFQDRKLYMPGASISESMWKANRFFDQISPRSHEYGHCVPLGCYVAEALIRYMPYFDVVGMSANVMDAFVVHFICRSFADIHPPPIEYLRELLGGDMAGENQASGAHALVRDAMLSALGPGTSFAKECIQSQRPWSKLMEYAREVMVDFLDERLRALGFADRSLLDKWDLSKEATEAASPHVVIEEDARLLCATVFAAAMQYEVTVPAMSLRERAGDARLSKRLRPLNNAEGEM